MTSDLIELYLPDTCTVHHSHQGIAYILYIYCNPLTYNIIIIHATSPPRALLGSSDVRMPPLILLEYELRTYFDVHFDDCSCSWELSLAIALSGLGFQSSSRLREFSTVGKGYYFTVFVFPSNHVIDGPSKTADGPSKYLRDLLP